jgi:hypothetical protein
MVQACRGMGGGPPPQIALNNLPAIGATGCVAAVGIGFSSICGLSIDPTGPAVAATAGGAGGMVSNSELSYSIQIVGPTGVTVPPIVKGSVATSAASFAPTGNIASSGYIEIVDPALDLNPSSLLLKVTACSNINNGIVDANCISSMLVDGLIPVQSNDILDVTLGAGADVELTGPVTANLASAFADPSFEIDPSFPLADEFSIVLSPGIGNPVAPPSSVPGPGSVVLLGTALSGFAACRRRG